MNIPLTYPINDLPPELLVSILHHLAQLCPLTLLLSQRVCRLWHTIITTSPTLQRDLYFRHTPPSSQDPTSIDSLGTLDPGSLKDLFNPLLVPSFGHLFGRDHYVRPYASVSSREREWRSRSEYAACRLLWWINDDEKKEKILRKEASWRRMLVCKRKIRRLVNGHALLNYWGTEATTTIVDFGSEAERQACGIEDDNKSWEKDINKSKDDWDFGMTMQDFYELLLSGDLWQGPQGFPEWSLFLEKTLSRWKNFQGCTEAGILTSTAFMGVPGETGQQEASRYHDDYGYMYHYLKDSPVENEGEYGTIDAVLLSVAVPEDAVGRPDQWAIAEVKVSGEPVPVVRSYTLQQIGYEINGN